MSLTPEEIRRRLRAARPGGQDDDAPDVAEALALAQRDPELARWLAEERQADARVTEALGTVAVPADLKTAILAQARAKAPARPRSFRRFSLPAFFAFAALFTAAATLLPPLLHPSYTRYEGDLVGQIASGEVLKLAFQSPSHATVEEWLAAHRAPSEIAVPFGLQSRPDIGCRTFEWKGRQIAQVCFALENGKIAHLFVVRNAGWKPSTAPPQGHPQFNRHGDWTLASWRDGTTTYVLAGEGDPATLLRFLQPQPHA